MTDLSLPFVLAQAGDAPTPPTPPVEAPAPPTPPGDLPLSSAPGTPGVPGAPAGAPPQGGFDGFMLILLLGFVLMFVFMMTGQRKEKKKRAAMLAGLKKGDKVTTVGGIIGNVVEVREDEIVLKVDENSNTRMRFSRAAIQNVVADKAE